MKGSLFFLLMLWPLFSQSQSLPVQWGEEFKMERRISIIGMMSDSSGFYVIKQNTKRNVHAVIVERFDPSDMLRKETREIVFPVIDSLQSSLNDFLVLGGRKWLLLETYSQRDKMRRLYARELLSEAGDGPLMLIDSLSYPGGKTAFSPEFTAVEMHDGKHLLIVRKLPHMNLFFYTFFNAAMKPVWKKPLDLPFESGKIKSTSFLGDKANNIHLICSTGEEKKRDDDAERPALHTYTLLSYYPDRNLVKEIEITLGEKYISALTFQLMDDGDLAIGGFYSNSREYAIAGTFFLRMNPETRKIVASDIKPFEKNILADYIPERRIKKGEQELSNFYFDHLVTLKDGTVFMVAEQYYLKVVYNSNDPLNNGYWGYGGYGYGSPYYGNTANYQYHYNDILVVKVNPDGGIAWTKKIPKKQMSTNDDGYYSSYAIANTSTEVFILFNDHPRNTPEFRNSGKELYVMSKASRSNAMLVRFGQEGNFLYQSLFSGKSMDLILRPKMFYQVSGQRLVLFSQQGSRYKFGGLLLP